jgi:hypothetical protein
MFNASFLLLDEVTLAVIKLCIFNFCDLLKSLDTGLCIPKISNCQHLTYLQAIIERMGELEKLD